MSSRPSESKGPAQLLDLPEARGNDEAPWVCAADDANHSSAPPSPTTSREFRRLIDAFHDGVAVVSRDALIYSNAAFAHLLGYAHKSDVFGVPPRDLLRRHASRAERGRIFRGLMAVIRGRAHHVEDERTLRQLDDGALVVHFYYDSIGFEGRPCAMITARDVSGERILTEKLTHAERMASVGSLAAGVAHEINNPLAYVTTNIAFCVERLRAVDAVLDAPLTEAPQGSTLRDLLGPMAQALSEAQQGANRVASIVRDLRALTREDRELDAPVDLQQVLETALHMCDTEFRYRASLVRKFEGVGAVWGNETRLVQVFLNLIINAAQAFTDQNVNANRITVRAFTEGAATVCEIEDNGIGIPEENLERIFHAFFTTKPIGVGTGLGLSICHGLVHSMRGKLSVQSRVGKGSCFRVTLVRCDDAKPRSTRRTPSTSPTGQARILIVDDEPLILRSVSRLLHDQHHVETAANGDEALQKLLHDEPYDIVVCDLMMPSMTGMELHAEVARTDPELAERFVFLTGGAFTEQARAFLAATGNPTLEKPVQSKLLRSVLNSVLNRTTTGAG